MRGAINLEKKTNKKKNQADVRVDVASEEQAAITRLQLLLSVAASLRLQERRSCVVLFPVDGHTCDVQVVHLAAARGTPGRAEALPSGLSLSLSLSPTRVVTCVGIPPG